MNDPYEALGIARTASAADIKAAFRRLARQAHPDVGGSDERMAEINAAWEILGNEAKRAEFDASGQVGSADSFEAECRSRLVSVFALALDAPTGDDDLVGVTRTIVSSTRSEIEKKLFAARSDVKRLQRRRDRVRRKGDGENLFVGLIDQQLVAIDAQVVRLERGRDVFARVSALLDEYEMAPAAFNQTGFASLGLGMFSSSLGSLP